MLTHIHRMLTQPTEVEQNAHTTDRSGTECSHNRQKWNRMLTIITPTIRHLSIEINVF